MEKKYDGLYELSVESIESLAEKLLVAAFGTVQ